MGEIPAGAITTVNTSPRDFADVGAKIYWTRRFDSVVQTNLKVKDAITEVDLT